MGPCLVPSPPSALCMRRKVRNSISRNWRNSLGRALRFDEEQGERLKFSHRTEWTRGRPVKMWVITYKIERVEEKAFGNTLEHARSSSTLSKKPLPSTPPPPSASSLLPLHPKERQRMRRRRRRRRRSRRRTLISRQDFFSISEKRVSSRCVT